MFKLLGGSAQQANSISSFKAFYISTASKVGIILALATIMIGVKRGVFFNEAGMESCRFFYGFNGYS